MVTRTYTCCAIAILFSVGAFSPAYAQSDETEVGEISALGGFNFGAGVRPAVTGSTGIAFSRYAIALFDTSFIPMGSRTIQSWPARSTVDHSYLLDFGMDFHIRIPLKRRLAPYGILGAGLLWNTFRHHTVDEQGLARTIRYDQFNGAVHTGAGVRYYVADGWGIRSEIKVIVSKQVYTQALMGVFYVTPVN